MNAKAYTIQLKMYPREVFEAINGLLHTLVFFRSSTVGQCETAGISNCTEITVFDSVACEQIPFSHVRLRSIELENLIRAKTNLFWKDLKKSDMRMGSMRVEFYEKSKEPLIPLFAKTETWEVWNFDVTLREQKFKPYGWSEERDELEEALIDGVHLMSTTATSSSYAPVAFSPEDIERVYDTSFVCIQPYHFKINHNVRYQGRRRNVYSDLFKWFERGSFLY